MEITDIEAIPLRRDLANRFANAQKWIDAREYCLVRVTLEDGTVGWGECWGPIAANRELITDYVSPWLVGRDVRDAEQIHDDLIFKLRSSYHSFVPASVVGGVDIACWDALGRALEESVSRLLGGRRRGVVRAYATGHFWDDVDDFEELKANVVAEATGHVDAGFDALKNKIGLPRHPDFPWGWEEDVELVEAIREAVGSDIRLSTDANHAYDLATATKVGRALSDLDVHFFEEPLPPNDIDGYATLNDAVDVSVAGGECWAFVDEFDRVMDARAADFVQPDVTSAGGLTSTRRIAVGANARNLQCIPHVFGSAIALAASLQAISTIPGDVMLEFDRSPNPIREELVVDPIRNDGNEVAIPDGPGLGIEVDLDVLAEFRV